jgi:homoserine trans-succinylase
VFQVCEELACDIHVFPLSVRLLDLFLAKIKTPRCNLQLLGATCLHVASKLRNTQLISTETMVYYTDNSIVAAEMNVSYNWFFQEFLLCMFDSNFQKLRKQEAQILIA